MSFRPIHIFRAAGLVFLMAVVPATASAQAAIAGSVKNVHGDPMAGVNVEASSPSLIERSRTVVTDMTGRYRIEDLRPGRYVVRFTLKGWTPVEHSGVELTGTLTATVDAELTVGPVTDTVTVTAEIPVVDVHTAKHELTLSGDVVRAIPTVRTYNALLPLIPGVVTNINDTITGPSATATSFPIHGGRTNEGRLLLDGLTIGSAPSGNSAASYVVDVGNAQEVTFTTAGGLGESETAGLVMNIVPKSGGNTTHGSLFATGTGAMFQSSNLTSALEAQGLTAATPLTRVYDFSATLGGPIVRDRVWYFVNAHIGGNTRESAAVYYNLNAGDPGKWLYAPDLSRREYSDRTFDNASGRITWQVTPRNRISAFWDQQSLCRNCTGSTPGLAEPQQVSPEAVGVLGRPLTVTQATWWSPLTSHVLVEAGYGGTYFGAGNFERMPNPTRNLIRVAEQCASGCAANGNIPGLVYRSQDFSVAHAGSYLWKGSLSVRHRHAQPEDRVSAHADDRRSHVDDERSEPDVPPEQWRAQPAHRVDLAVGEQRARRLGRRLRPGAMDTLQAHAAGRAALRSRAELVSGAAGGAVAVSPGADRDSGNTRCRQLQGHHAEIRPRLRRLRRRQDRLQAERRPVPGGRGRLRHLRQQQSGAADAADDVGVRHGGRDARVDRREPELRPRLRSFEPERAGSPRERRRSLRRRFQHALRAERTDEQLRRRHPERLGRAAVGLGREPFVAAADSIAHVGASDVRSARLSRLLGGGQPGARAVRSHALQHHGARRSAAARRRRLRRVRPLRRRARESRSGRQPRRRFDASTARGRSTSTAST